MKISVIVPCYNEQDTVQRFYDAIKPILTSLDGFYHEIIFVNDGSRDNTREILSRVAANDENVKVVTFSRNFGQQAAILCGFGKCSGDCAIELDCDLQDPVEVIPQMVAKWKEGYDVVHGRRVRRKGETLFKKITAYFYYKRLARISSVDIPRDTGDFKLLDRKVLDVIISLPERNKYLRGLESWVGFRQAFVDYERKERVGGKTHYTLKKMVALAKAGVIANSNHPLTLSLKLGITMSVLSVLGFAALIVLAAAGVDFDAAMWILPTVTITGSMVILCNAITDMYIEKIHEQTQNRPEYIIEEETNFPAK